MAEYTNARSYPVELNTGRMLAPGATANIDATNAHNLALITAQDLILYNAATPPEDPDDLYVNVARRTFVADEGLTPPATADRGGDIVIGADGVIGKRDAAGVVTPHLSVASGDEAVYRSRGIPSVLDFNDGSLPDGSADNIEAFEAAAADALARGKAQVVVPAAASAWRVSRPLPLTVDWIGFGRHAGGTKVKATADFEGTKVFDIDSTSNVMRRVAHMRIDCSMVPGLRAIGSDDAYGAGIGRLHEVHVINVAPSIVTRLASGITLGGTKVLSVEDATRFQPGIVKFAGSGSSITVTAVDNEADTITVSGGSGTYAAGHALEQPVWAIEAGPAGSTATGAMVGWIMDGVQLNNCAHLLRLPVTAGDDLNVLNFRSGVVEAAAVSTTLSDDFIAGTDTTVPLASVSGLRPSGRVVVGGEDVWYTGISGGQLTGIYTAHVGTISSGATVEQFTRPIDAPFDIDGVNMRFESIYTQLGVTDDPGSGGIKALWKIGGQVAHLANLFPEEATTGHNFTHLFWPQQPGCALEIDGISPNFDTASDYVAMVRTQLGSPMSASQRKYLAIRNYRPDSTDVSDEHPLVDVFVGSDAESNANALDLHVEGVNAATKLGRFGASSTTSSSGAGVVRLTGTWKGQRLDDRLACLTADADWPDLISHYAQSYGVPESAITARPGSTHHSRRSGTGVSSFYPVFSRKLSGSSNTGWVGDYYGTGSPDFDAPVGSVYINLTTGLRWYKIATTSAGWVTGGEVSLQGWLADDAQTVTLGIVPIGAVMLSHSLYVHEAFNSDGTDNIRAGHDAASDVFFADTDVATTGNKTVAAGTGGTYRTSAVTAKAYYANGGSEPTTGKALVTVRFSFPPPIPA